MRQRRNAGGRLFKRRSRLTGAELPTWWCAYYVDGKERRESTGAADHDEAQRFLRKRQVAVDDGTITAAARDRLTVAAILDLVRGHYALQGHRTTDTVQSHVRQLTAALGSTRRALDVTTGQVQRVLERWRAAGFSAATCNRRLAVLRRAYHLAKLRLDPARLDFGDLFLPEQSPRGKYMSPDVFARIHAALPTDDLRGFFEFSYTCGTRKQQLARTTVAHVNPSTWTVTWPATEVKAKEPHVLALDGRALAIIQAQLARRPLHCRYLFHGPLCAPGHTPSQRYACIGDVKKAWRTAVTSAGFTVGRKAGGFVWHNTRHSAVTNLVNAGVPKHEAKGVSGHRTDAIFDRYSIGTEQQQRAALRAATLYQQEFTGTPVVPLTARKGKTTA